MNPESSLNATKRCLRCRSRQLGSFHLSSVLCFFFLCNFLMLLSELTSLISSPYSSDPSLLWLRSAAGSGGETALGAGRGKGQSFSGGKQRPGRLLCVTSDKFPNTALPHFPIEIESSPPRWVTTTRICAAGLVLPTWG